MLKTTETRWQRMFATSIKEIEFEHDILYPSDDKNGKAPLRKLWVVRFATEFGTLAPQTNAMIFPTQDKANEFLQRRRDSVLSNSAVQELDGALFNWEKSIRLENMSFLTSSIDSPPDQSLAERGVLLACATLQKSGIFDYTLISESPSSGEFDPQLEYDNLLRHHFQIEPKSKDTAHFSEMEMRKFSFDVFSTLKAAFDASITEHYEVTLSPKVQQDVGDFIYAPSGQSLTEEYKSEKPDEFIIFAANKYSRLNHPHRDREVVASDLLFALSNQRYLEAGYKLRDLEILMLGVEPETAKSRRQIAGAKLGGKISSAAAAQNRESVISKMSDLIASGLSISNAALIAHKRGMGTSQEANRKLWNRHCRDNT